MTVDKPENYDKIYFCPWRKNIVVFNSNITKDKEVPIELFGNIEKYHERATLLGGGFVNE